MRICIILVTDPSSYHSIVPGIMMVTLMASMFSAVTSEMAAV